jgi:isoleucyl-tRNA synthetase
MAELQGLVKYVHEQMEEYRLYTVLPALVTFKTQLSNWYVRLNRDRLKGQEGEGESTTVKANAVEAGLQVLYSVLLDLTILMAPFTPFLAEFLYQNLRKVQPSYALAANGGGTSNPVMPGKSDSVHFLRLPQYDASRLNPQACEAMHVFQSIVELGRKVRESRNIGYRTPVKCVMVVLRNPAPYVVDAISGSLRKYVLLELNTWDFQVVPKNQESEWIRLSLVPVFPVLGRKLGRKMSAVSKFIKGLSHEVRSFSFIRDKT